MINKSQLCTNYPSVKHFHNIHPTNLFSFSFSGYTSVSIAFITFIVILGYDNFQQSRHTKLCKKIFKLKSTDKKVSFKED